MQPYIVIADPFLLSIDQITQGMGGCHRVAVSSRVNRTQHFEEADAVLPVALCLQSEAVQLKPADAGQAAAFEFALQISIAQHGGQSLAVSPG